MSTYVITEPCVGVKEGSCVDVCPAACIHTRPDSPQFYIDPEICIACEQCVVVCPVDAIFLDEEVPAKWESYIAINAEFFHNNKPAVQSITLSRANELLDSVVSYASVNGIAVSAVVVDQAGSPIAERRMAPSDPSTVRVAQDRAYTAVTLESPTHLIGTGPVRRSSQIDSQRLVRTAGGFPILEDHVIVGAIGVAGSPSPQQDVLCCQAGLTAALPGPSSVK